MGKHIHVKKGGAGDGSSAESALPNIASGLRAAQGGDTVWVHSGTYAENVSISRPGIALKSVEKMGAVLDGEWDGKLPGGGYMPMVLINAASTTVDGFRIINSGGRGITIGKPAIDSMVLNCWTDNTFGGGIIINEGVNILVSDTIVTRAGMSYAAGQGPQVSGSFNIVKGTNCVLRRVTVGLGHGEGINIGKGSEGCVVQDCVVFDNSHLCLYFNRSTRCVARGNIIFLTGDEAHNVGREEWPGGIIIGDEVSTLANKYPHSSRNEITNNLVVNCGTLFGVRNNKAADGYDTQLDPQTIVARNTFVAGPCTSKGMNVGDNLFNHPHGAAVIRDNLVDFSQAPDGAIIGNAGKQGLAWSRNAWTVQPMDGCRGEGDVYGDLRLVRPGAVITVLDGGADTSFSVNNYRPAPLSPVVGAGTDGTTIGALLPVSGPVDEPPFVPDVAAALVTLKEALMLIDTFEESRAIITAAYMQIIEEQLSVAVSAVHAAAEEVSAAIKKLERQQ